MDTSLIVLVLILLLVGLPSLFVLMAVIVAIIWWLRRPEEPAAPDLLTATVEVEHTAALPRTSAPSARASTPGPMSALDLMARDDFPKLDSEEIAPTVRLQRPSSQTPPTPPTPPTPSRPPAIPVEWAHDDDLDDAPPTELFQVGMQSGSQVAMEGDATEVFDAHEPEAFAIGDLDPTTGES